MSKQKNKTGIIIACILCCTGCKEPFTPEIPFEETNFLVIEGYINVGPGNTILKLSRTIKVNAGSPLFETDAIVRIESDDYTSYSLTEKGSGIYSSGDLDLPVTKRYRINIKVKTGKEYISDFVGPIQTPAIDSITWTSHRDGVHINLSTHDPLNSTTYYQWEYEETWEIRSAFTAYLKYENKSLQSLSNDETVAMFRCWKYNAPPDLILHSTAKLTSDVVTAYPLVFIPLNSERLSERYHIRVKQHALSRDAFDYLQLMKKNTGPLGTFSDPQPSELIGNIHCTTTEEPVVGYVGAYTTEQISFYINRWDVPTWNYSLFCEQKRILNHPDTLAKYLTSRVNRPTLGAAYEEGTGAILEVFHAPDICVDCSRRGGDSRKPDFWE